ncbi:MAG TPA: DUF4433 domain-containing protein [bacterium]|jgi:hypothetical protein|nr:DUF4433 domain-containing protein [bacterium]MDX9806009.1 DUF4433 domain-containing protein [bacterium]HNZ53820.1 DUF4433 domain-containing protein [bacterium]HOG43107.1 DUF4433 domain-containing protein [bacterium]HPM45880.1 DUF4433 domain-containing protein [bacterium]
MVEFTGVKNIVPHNPNQIPLFHITHVDNLYAIIKSGGLWCDRERIIQGFSSANIAHKPLKDRRMATKVPLYLPKTLGDFVPFYFTTRSPMLFSVHTGSVDDCSYGQESIIYLITTTENLTTCQRNWCFTDGHAVEAISEFYNNLNDMDKVDWNLINDWSWHNTLEDSDRKRRKQAEFLVEKSVPFSAFIEISVINEEMERKIHKILEMAKINLAVSVKPKWYY